MGDGRAGINASLLNQAGPTLVGNLPDRCGVGFVRVGGISGIWVMAGIGSALTAGHFGKAPK